MNTTTIEVHPARRRAAMPSAPLVLLGGAVALQFAFLLRGRMVDSDVPFQWMTPALCALALAHALVAMGWRRALSFFGIAFTLSAAAELSGTAGGWVFGEYHYTDVFPHKLLGRVPALIPMGWFVMLYPCHIVANLTVHGRFDGPWRGWSGAVGLSLLGALMMTGWDVAVDPHVVHRTGAWVWANPGAHFGIPLSNYLGWVLTSFVILMLQRLVERFVGSRAPRPMPTWFQALPLASFCLMILGHIVYGQPDATLLVPLAILGTPLLIAVAALRSRANVSRGD